MGSRTAAVHCGWLPYTPLDHVAVTGAVTRVSDSVSSDTQCLRTDYLRRLTEAWTLREDSMRVRYLGGSGQDGQGLGALVVAVNILFLRLLS
jgi:hypothetical protein